MANSVRPEEMPRAPARRPRPPATRAASLSTRPGTRSPAGRGRWARRVDAGRLVASMPVGPACPRLRPGARALPDAAGGMPRAPRPGSGARGLEGRGRWARRHRSRLARPGAARPVAAEDDWGRLEGDTRPFATRSLLMLARPKGSGAAGRRASGCGDAPADRVRPAGGRAPIRVTVFGSGRSRAPGPGSSGCGCAEWRTATPPGSHP